MSYDFSRLKNGDYVIVHTDMASFKDETPGITEDMRRMAGKPIKVRYASADRVHATAFSWLFKWLLPVNRDTLNELYYKGLIDSDQMRKIESELD